MAMCGLRMRLALRGELPRVGVCSFAAPRVVKLSSCDELEQWRVHFLVAVPALGSGVQASSVWYASCYFTFALP